MRYLFLRPALTGLFFMGMLSACDKVPKLGPGDENHLASAAEEDCGFVQNSYGQRVSWKSTLPVRLLIHPNFPSEYINILKAAGTRWEDAAGKTLFQYDVAASNTSEIPQKDSSNVVYYLSDWDASQKEVQALTSIYWSRNVILETDLKVDAKFFNYYADTPSSAGDVHFESLLVHELGHVLGLKHKNISPTVMWPSLRGSTVREDLSDADKLSVKCEY